MQTTVLLGLPEQQELPFFSDSVDRLTAPSNNAKCGAKTYSISPAPAYLTLTGTTLSLQTADAQYIGTHTIELQVLMEEYPLVPAFLFQFDVVIDPCIPSLAATTIADQTYTVYDPELPISILDFIETPSCGYS
jgi:hypothetical protein